MRASRPRLRCLILVAVCKAQLSLGWPGPRETSSLPILKRVQAGIARVKLQRGRSTRIRLSISAELLDHIKVALRKSSDPERAPFWAICCIAFLGFSVWESCCCRPTSMADSIWRGETWRSTTRHIRPWRGSFWRDRKLIRLERVVMWWWAGLVGSCARLQLSKCFSFSWFSCHN